MPPTAALKPLATTILLALAIAPTGCKSGSGSGSSSGGGNYVQQYREGDYSDAYNEAAAAYMATDGKAKDRAACIAGISAYSMGRRELAEQWLTPVVASSDTETAGTAGWTLGLIAADRQQHARALSYFDQALPKLQGDDAANLQIAAAESLAKLGRTAEARQRLQAAQTLAQTDIVKTRSSQRLVALNSGNLNAFTPTGPQVGRPSTLPPAVGTGKGSFVIQLGAFANRPAAESLASRSASNAARAGLPAPRIVTSTDPRTGRALFAVRVGSFANRQTAEQSQRSLGLGGTVMQAIN